MEGIYNIIHSKKKLSDIPTVFIQDQINIKETFNNKKQNKKIVPPNVPYRNFLPNPQNKSFFIAPINPEEITKLIQSLNNDKSIGPNSIPTKFLKILCPAICEKLSELFNECITAGIFPDCLKKSFIVPIHKKDSKLDPGNYRPISILSNRQII